MNLQLKRLRQLRGLSQEDMASKLDIKKSRYGTWERGDRMMSLEQAYMITEILGCTLDELVGREPSVSYSDPMQAELNSCYSKMNESGRTLLAEAAKSIAADPARRIVKDRAQHLDDTGAMGA